MERLLKAAIDVSHVAGGIQTSTRYVQATKLYTRLTVAAYTFVRLLPANGITRDAVEFWDWPSVACVARNIVETYHMFHYLSAATLSEEECDMRISLMHLHLNSEKYRLYKEWKPDHEVLKEFEQGLPKDRIRLREKSAFKKLPQARQTELLKGRNAMHLTHAEVGESLPFIGKHFRPLYRLLSTHVHSVPFSFQAQSNERGRGDENDAERFYMSLAISIVVRYLSAAILDMARIFPDEIGSARPDAIATARDMHARESD